MAVSLRQLKEDVGLPYEEKSTEPIIQEQQNTGVSLSKMKADAGISIPKAVMPENTYSDFSSVFGKLNNNYKPKLAGCVDYVFNTIKKNGGATDFINAGNTWNDFIKRGTRITPNDISKVPDGAVVGFLNTSSGNNHMAIVYTDSNGVKRLNENLSRYSQGKAWLANNRTLASQVAKDETLMYMPKYNSNTLGHYKSITPVKKTQAPDISNVIDSEKFTNTLSRLYTQGIGHKQATDIILKANPELAKYKDSIYKKANEIEYTHNQNVAAAETKKVRGMKNEFSNFFGFTPTNNPVNTRFKHQNTIDDFNKIAAESVSKLKLYSNYFDIKNKSFSEWEDKDKSNFKKLFNDIEKKVNAKGFKWNKEAVYTGLKDFINTGTAIDVKGTQKPTYTEASEKFSVGKALQTGATSVVSSAIGSIDNMVNLFGAGVHNQVRYEEWLNSKNIKTDDISKRLADIGFAIAPIPISKGRIGFDIIKNGKTILEGIKDINKAKAILVNLANMAKELNVAKTAVAGAKLAGTVYASGTAGQVARDAADVVTDNVDKLGIYDPEDFTPVARTLVQIKNAAIKGAVTLSAQQALKDRKLDEYIAKSDIAQKIIISDEFNNFVSAPFTKGALTEFIKDPIGITASVLAQSFAMYAPALIEGRALGSVFGRVGLGAGIGKGSYELEYASKVIGVMQDAGVDITNEKSLRSAFANPGLFAKAHKLARRRGLTVAMFDILSVGLAGRLWGRAGESMASKVLTGLAEVTIQGLFGAGGEMAAAIVTGEDIVAGAVLSEYLGEIGTGGVEVATAVKQSQHSQIEQHLKTIGSGDITPENINIVDAIVFAKNPNIAKDIGASPDSINNLNIEPNEEEYNKFYLDNIGKTANEQSKIFKELSGIENKIAQGRYTNNDVERYKILVSFADNVTPSPQIAEEEITEDNPDILDAEEQDLISRQLDTKIDRNIIVQQWADAKGVENQDIENEIDSKTDQTESTDIDTTPDAVVTEEEPNFNEQVPVDTEVDDITTEEQAPLLQDIEDDNLDEVISIANDVSNEQPPLLDTLDDTISTITDIMSDEVSAAETSTSEVTHGKATQQQQTGQDSSEEKPLKLTHIPSHDVEYRETDNIRFKREKTFISTEIKLTPSMLKQLLVKGSEIDVDGYKVFAVRVDFNRFSIFARDNDVLFVRKDNGLLGISDTSKSRTVTLYRQEAAKSDAYWYNFLPNDVNQRHNPSFVRVETSAFDNYRIVNKSPDGFYKLDKDATKYTETDKLRIVQMPNSKRIYADVILTDAQINELLYYGAVLDVDGYKIVSTNDTTKEDMQDVYFIDGDIVYKYKLKDFADNNANTILFERTVTSTKNMYWDEIPEDIKSLLGIPERKTKIPVADIRVSEQQQGDVIDESGKYKIITYAETPNVTINRFAYHNSIEARVRITSEQRKELRTNDTVLDIDGYKVVSKILNDGYYARYFIDGDIVYNVGSLSSDAYGSNYYLVFNRAVGDKIDYIPGSIKDMYIASTPKTQIPTAENRTAGTPIRETIVKRESEETWQTVKVRETNNVKLDTESHRGAVTAKLRLTARQIKQLFSQEEEIDVDGYKVFSTKESDNNNINLLLRDGEVLFVGENNTVIDTTKPAKATTLLFARMVYDPAEAYWERQLESTRRLHNPNYTQEPVQKTDINKLPPKKQLEQLVKDNTITKTQSAAIKERIMDDEELNRSGEPALYPVAKHLNLATKLLIKLSKAESENNIKMSQDDYSDIISSVFSNKTFKGKLTEKQINNIVDASVKAVKKSVRIDPKEYIKSEFENNDIISGMPQETIDKIRKALTNASKASKADTPLAERVYNKLNGIGQKTKKTVEDIQAQQAERDIQNTDIDVTVDENNTIDTALEKLDATDVPNDNITMEQVETISDIIENSKELNKDIEDNGHFNVHDIMHMDLTQEEMKIRARMPNKNIDKADVIPNRIVNDATRHDDVLASNPSDYLASYYDLCVDIVKLTNMKFSRMYGRNDYPAHVLERTFLAEVKSKFRNNQYVIAHEFGHAKAIEMGIQPRENIDLSEPNTGNGLTVEEVAEIIPFSDNTTEKGRFSSYTEEKFKDADEATALRYQISEGIAEIMRNYLLTPEKNDAPLMYDKFDKWFASQGQSKQITQIRNKAGGYNRARLLDRAELRNKISKTTGTEKFFNILKYIAKGHFIDKTTTDFVDALAPMRFVQEILTGKNNSQYISERNGYDLARLSRGSEAIVNVELNKLYTILANTGDKTVGTGDWVTYLRTKHIENLLKAEAYESDLTIDDTTEIISELDANYPHFAKSAEDYMDWWRSFVAVYEKDFMSPTLYRRATINYNAEITKLQNKQPATEQEKTDIEKEIARLEKERLSNEYYVPLNVLLEPFIGGESFAQGQGSGVNASFVNQRKAYMHRRGNQTFPYLNWVELIANRVATSTKKHMMNNAAQAFFEQMGDKEKSGLFFKEQTELYTVERIRDILIKHLAENKPDVHDVYEKYIAYLAVNQRKTSSTETQASFIKHIQGGAYDANAEARNTMALSFMQNSGVIEDIINNEEINIFNRAKALTKSMINNNIVMVMKNGQPKFYSVFDKELYDSLTNMEQDKRWKGIQRKVGLYLGARIVREFVTLYPLFSFNNSFKDGLTLASMSRGKYIPGVSFFEGFAHIHNKDEWYNNFIKYGAGLSTPSTEGEAKLLTLNSKNKNVILKTIQGAFDLRDTAENANRVANFQVTYNALREMGYSEEAAYTKSAFESRDVLDWAMRGKSEWFNTILSAVAFSRSFINGNAKLLSMVAKGDNATRQKILLYNFVIGTIPALLETLKYKDDDEYKNMGKYIKDHYYLIKLRKGVWLRLPIPFELGLTFNAYPKRIFNATIGKDENAMKEWFKLLQTYMLSFVPNTAQIVYNLAVNKDDYTGNAIVGYYQAGGTSQLLPEFQKKKNTSLTTVELAEWVNPEVPLSPAKTEYFIKQIAPYFGELALATTDALLSKIIDGQEEEKQSRNNVLKTVLVKDNVYSDWYDSFLKLHTEIKRAYNSMQTKTDEKEQNEVAKKYGYKNADTLKKAWQAVHNTELLFNGKLPVTEEEIGTGVIKRKYIETITPDGRTKRNTVYQDSPITKYFESYNNVDKRTAYKSEVADLSKYTIKEVERLIKGEN